MDLEELGHLGHSQQLGQLGYCWSPRLVTTGALRLPVVEYFVEDMINHGRGLNTTAHGSATCAGSEAGGWSAFCAGAVSTASKAHPRADDADVDEHVGVDVATVRSKRPPADRVGASR